MKEKFNINKSLIWDYDFKGAYDTEQFKIWYIARVLNYGTKNDIREIGIDSIKQNFRYLNLTTRIKQFWEWYFEYTRS